MSREFTEKFIVRYRNETYDITNFLHKHPGGVNTLKGLENSDMTERFMKAPPHSDAAMYLMKEYKCENPESTKTKYLNGDRNGNVKHIIQSNDGHTYTTVDESMEHLVDWSKAMLPQISSLKENYDEWVNKPVDRPLKLFDAWYLEMLTKTPWWLVPLFWIPAIIYLFQSESLDNNPHKLSIKTSNVILGIILWTLIEYSLHRWVFHMETKKPNKWNCTFHFILHGLHHKVPFDPYRLVFPPFPAVIIATIFYIPISVAAPYPKLLLSGGLLGYLIYDMTHYYLHYGNPRVKHFYQMKRYHYQHHFAHHTLGFGISSPVWDFVFGTSICLRKLKYILKW